MDCSHKCASAECKDEASQQSAFPAQPGTLLFNMSHNNNNSSRTAVPTGSSRLLSGTASKYTYVCAAAIGGVVTLAAVPAVVTAVGFTSTGVAGGSFAAAWQSTLGGCIASGSTFATLQSVGAAGMGVAAKVVAASIGGATAVAATSVGSSVTNDVSRSKPGGAATSRIQAGLNQVGHGVQIGGKTGFGLMCRGMHAGGRAVYAGAKWGTKAGTQARAAAAAAVGATAHRASAAYMVYKQTQKAKQLDTESTIRSSSMTCDVLGKESLLSWKLSEVVRDGTAHDSHDIRLAMT